MAFTFKGTYTKNRGDQAAAGSVEILSKRGVSLADEELDENGSYEVAIDAQEGEVTVVETITGVVARSYPVSVSRGSTTDTSRDIGYVGPSAGGSVDLTAYVGNVDAWASDADGVIVMYAGEGGEAQIRLDGAAGSATLENTEGTNSIKVDATGIGFFAHATAARPEVPATPDAQDVVDALVALGLVTQAAP